MIDIIKVELFRLKKSVLFWVMLGLTVAIPILGALASLTVSGVVGSSGAETGNLLKEMGLLSQYLKGMAELGNWAVIFSLVTTAIVLSTEFVDGTVRNILLANKSRAELYFSYLITSICVAVTYFVAYFAATLLIVAPIFGFDGMTAGQGVSACFTSLALGIVSVIFAETCMCMFMFTMRKQWAAILMPLLICIFVPALVTVFATLIITTSALKGQAVSMDSLRWVPFTNAELYTPSNIDGVVVGMNILYLAIFSVMFVLIGYYVFKKSDLK